MATSTIKRSVSSLNGVSLYDSKTSRDLKIGIAETVNQSFSNKSVPNATSTNIGSVSLTKGTWIINGVVRFPHTNETGKRSIILASTSGGSWLNNYGCVADLQPASTGNDTVTIMNLHIVTADSQTIYLNCYQNSGAAITTSQQWIHAWKI